MHAALSAAVEAFLQFEPLTQFLAAIALFLIVPEICERLNIPRVLGFLLLGWGLGPYGVGLLDPNGIMNRIGAELGVGLLLFFIGLEIDFAVLNRARLEVAFFGIVTFLFPFLGGYAVGRLVGFGPTPAVLIGSLLASHTLLGHSIVERAGLNGRVSVVAAVGATVFTDITSMIVLAICLLIHRSGFSQSLIAQQLLQVAVFVPLMLFGASWLVKRIVHRWALPRETRLLLFFSLVAGGAELATLFGIDGIVGAFMAGIATRRGLSEEGPLASLKEVSNAFIIPSFFIATGMLIQPVLLVETLRDQPALALGLPLALVAGKLAAAWINGKVFGHGWRDIGLMWSLTLPQVAATLAATTVAYRTLNAAGEPLIPHEVLNAVLVLVMFTAIGGPLLTQGFTRRLLAETGLAPSVIAMAPGAVSLTSAVLPVPGTAAALSPATTDAGSIAPPLAAPAPAITAPPVASALSSGDAVTPPGIRG